MLAQVSGENVIEDWWEDARCRDGEGSLTRVFFSEELQDIARAKTICSECPAILECLEGAIARHEPWGVWGGQMFLNGKILATKRRRGRPPKTPRPEDQLPDIPVPVHLQTYLRSARSAVAITPLPSVPPALGSGPGCSPKASQGDGRYGT